MSHSNSSENSAKKVTKGDKIKCVVFLILYLLFLYWVKSWWGLLATPFIFDKYITKKIHWNWWKNWKNNTARSIMAWVDAIVFALVAVYFLNQFFFQNYVIPSSSLEKTLLTGDYLMVSKIAYGPRIPQTPLHMPLCQHTLPIINTNSYIDFPHWQYRRVKGLGQPRLNDIVVFNYPSGDSVLTKAQDQDYYRLIYQIGEQLMLQNSPDSLSPVQRLGANASYEAQQQIYRQLYAAGRSYALADPQQFGNLVYRPAGRRENYVKRCVGLPGQTLQIKNNRIYLDGKLNPTPKNAQFTYEVKFKRPLTEDERKEWNITNEDLQQYQAGGIYSMPLTAAVKKALEDNHLTDYIRPVPPTKDWLYPLNMKKNWSAANYGPIWIPKKGVTLKLTLQNLPVYERPIRVYEHNRLSVKGNQIYINGKPADHYTFKMNYYWMMGDNRDNSADSRFWGFVPEDHVVGKPIFIWLSLDKDYGWFDGKIRWNRIFRVVSHLQ